MWLYSNVCKLYLGLQQTADGPGSQEVKLNQIKVTLSQHILISEYNLRRLLFFVLFRFFLRQKANLANAKMNKTKKKMYLRRLEDR